MLEQVSRAGWSWKPSPAPITATTSSIGPRSVLQRFQEQRSSAGFRERLQYRTRDELLQCVFGWPVFEETPSPERLGARDAPARHTSASGLIRTSRPPPGTYNGRAALHLARVFIPCQVPFGACSLIRDVSGERNLRPKGQGVHLEAADHIPMTFKRAHLVASTPQVTFVQFVFTSCSSH